jgi:hypothetical protein
MGDTTRGPIGSAPSRAILSTSGMHDHPVPRKNLHVIGEYKYIARSVP